MRNRPDSRHRLSGLQAGASVGRHAQPVSPSEIAWAETDVDAAGLGARPEQSNGGWVPDWADVDRAGTDREDVERPDVDRADTDRADAEARGAGSADQTTSSRAQRVRPRRRVPWRRTAERWIPETVRDSRIDPGRRGALLLTVVAAAAALIAAVGVWRDRPEPRPVQAVSLSQVTDGSSSSRAQAARATGSLTAVSATASAAAPSGASRSATDGSGSKSPTRVIVVSVTGAVRRPGLVRLTAGSRVADAIEKAGGATSQADLTGLNLAQKLSDGASVVVGGGDLASSGGRSSVSGGDSSSDDGSNGGAAGTAGIATGSVLQLDLNSADVAALDALPGVGPVTAASIVAWRVKNGRFTSVEQLQEISGIGPAKYAALAPLVRV